MARSLSLLTGRTSTGSERTRRPVLSRICRRDDHEKKVVYVRKKIKKNKNAEKIVILDCFSGISGDMTIGACLDAGVDFRVLSTELKKLGLRGYTVHRRRIKKKGIRATDFTVRLTKEKKRPAPSQHGHHHHHHHGVTLGAIKKMITGSTLSDTVKKLSCAIFTVLARAEAAVHGTSVNAVHFHEVGAVDSIVDIVGTAICLEALAIDTVYATNIHLGRGVAHGKSHGSIPIPAPAVVKLLEGYPVVFSARGHELVTPTGASFIRTLSDPQSEIPPNIRIERIGYGAGEAEFEDQANVLRIMIGHAVDDATQRDTVVLIEANIDDMSPLVYADLFDEAFRAGARDVYLTPILMKKGRPAHVLSILCDPCLKERLSELVFTRTTSVGVRFSEHTRSVLPRAMRTIQTVFGPVAVKEVRLPDGTRRAYPEYEECRTIAREKKVALQKVYRVLESAISRVYGEGV